ncbi:hypothetical protein [Rufibacter tibetensis]|uniref:Uncharacterized protein n=1 Tax=Rufibacter tibetensis TaxID=512763 RepID=A0A0P0C5D3_9BACT|nr:hypothetical protein [Rufibacter tibetensis]ALJ00413.1 hypothetical protein DC20_17335 [Rufibacter tibetensis]
MPKTDVMKEKDIISQALRQIIKNLEELEGLPEEKHRITLPLVDNLREALDLLRSLQQGYPEDDYCHVINYCLMKLEFAKKQVEYGDVEEGLSFTKSILIYFLKETDLKKN